LKKASLKTLHWRIVVYFLCVLANVDAVLITLLALDSCCSSGAFFSVYSSVARWFIFEPKHPNLGKFWRAFELKMLVYFMVICNILHPFGIFYGH
jgi:hypothetical protein